jgi:hypothetical protein
MKNIAKILCFLLSLVLIISVMGVSAFADETNDNYVAYNVNSDFEVVGYYETLSEAIANYVDGGYIYLVADVTESIQSFSGINLAVDTDVVESVTINNTYDQALVDFDNVGLGTGITLNVKTLYTGGSENSIDGTVNVEGDYLHGYDANTFVFGTLNVGGELLITENTDSFCGVSVYGNLTAGDITVENGSFNFYGSTLTADSFTVASIYDSNVYIEGSSAFGSVNISAVADYKAVDNGDGTFSIVMKNYVAEVDGVKYEDFVAALKALQEGSTLSILTDITIDGEWQRSGTGKGGKYITKSVTIEGNEYTLTFTGNIVDPNYKAIFSFLGENVVINDLTIDATKATDYKEIINARYSVELNNCNFYGNGNRSAVMYGQGAGAALGTVTATINGCTFSGVKNGVTDNMSGKSEDAKSVTITDSTFDGCRVNVSAAESIVFTGNSVYGAQVILTTNSASEVLDVTATGNELDANYYNWTSAVSGTIQSGFQATTAGDIYIGDNGNWFVGGVDTGYIAVPSITIEDGCWVINGYPTGITAEAVSGVPSRISIVNGYWYVNDTNTKVRAEAIDGVGVAKVEKNDALSNTNVSTFVITFTDGTTFQFTVNNGLDGNQGAPGNPGPMGPQGPIGAPGANGVDGEDNQETLQIAIIVAGASVLLALIVLGCRVFKKDRFALPF